MNRYHIQRGVYIVGLLFIAIAISVSFYTATTGAIKKANEDRSEASAKTAEAEKMMKAAKTAKEDAEVKVRVEFAAGSKNLRKLFEARRESLKALNAPKDDYDRLGDEYKAAKAQGLLP